MDDMKSKTKTIAISFMAVVMMLLTASVSYAETVKGRITDANGEPLIGASVLTKSSNPPVATITDVDGNFSMDVKAGEELEISCIGFKSITVKAGDNLSALVLQEDNELLDELVVVGYGAQKKVNLTGAVAAVSSEVFEDKSTGSASQMLQGVMPNVNVSMSQGTPGSEGTISIRGMGSINSSSPLVLIDGVPGNIDEVNPTDIESISVLKDAASAAIYGSRAAFGVILVTRKSAKEGKAKVSYNAYFSTSTPTVSTNFETCGYDHAYIYDMSYMGQKGVMGAATGLTEEDYTELLKRRNDRKEKKSRPWVVLDDYNRMHYYGNFDWWHYLYRDWTPTMSHNVSVSGGNENIKYYVSGSYYMKKGFTRAEEKYEQFTLNAKIDAKVTKWLRMTDQVSFFDSEHAYPGENASNASFARISINCAPYYVPIGADGNWTGLMANGKLISEGRVADMYGGVSKGNKGKRNFKNTFALIVTPVKGLSLNFDYTYGFNMNDSWKRQGLVYVSTGVYGETMKSTTSTHSQDYYKKSMSYDPQHIINAYASYNGSWSDHNLSLTAGINYEKQSYYDLMGYRTDVISDTLNDLDLATGGATVDETGKIVGEIKAEGGAKAYQLFGAFLRANYNYKDRYLIEFNARCDGSSRFFPENRWGFFPSVSGAWRMSEENWMKQQKTVNNLKLRASYGLLGNQLGVATYPYSTISQTQMSYIIDGNLAYKLSTPQPVSGDYTWEKVATFDVGVDLGLFKNRLSLTADYFLRNTYDMFVDGVTLPAVYGADPPRQNAVAMVTNGFEISLSWKDDKVIAGHNFSYSVFATLGDSVSKITKYSGNDNMLLSDYYVGMTVGEIWGYRVGGLFQSDAEAAEYTRRVDQTYVCRDIYGKSQGEWAVARGGDVKYLDRNGDNVINNGNNTLSDHGDLEVIGNSRPRFNYSFGFSLAYFGFDLSMMFQGIGKCDFYPDKEMEKFWGPWGRVNAAFLPKGIANEAWFEDNPDAYFPRLQRGGAAYLDRGQMTTVNDRYLQSLAYLRLKNVSLGYTLPAAWLKAIHIEKFRVYVSGENLFYASPFHTKYVDPEQAMASKDGRVYPFSKTITVGLNLTF